MKKRLNVLFIDDAEDIVFLLGHVLKRGGYEVHSERVETAESLEKSLSSGVWDIILSDHSMPNFRSMDALSILKKSSLDIPFIVVSGTRDDAVAADAIAGGAFDFVSKDSIDRLLPTVERALREFKNRTTRSAGQVSLLLP